MTIYLYAELTDTYVPSEIQDIIGEYFDMNAGNPEERRFFQEWFDTQRQERDSSGRDLPELTTIQKLILQYPHIGDMLNHYFDRLKDSLEDDYAGDPFTTDLFFEAHDTFTYLEEYAFYDGRNPNPAKAAEMQRMLDEYSRRYNVAPPPAGSTDRRSLARSGTPRAGPAAEGGLNAFEAYRFNQLAERYLLHKHGRNSPPLSQELRHEFHALILRLPGDERALWLERFNVVVPTSTPGTPTSVPTATLTAYPEDGLNINIVIERFNRHYDGTLGNEPPFSPAEIDYLRNALLRWPDDFGILRLKFFELYPYELPTVTPEATRPLGPSAGLAVPPQLSMIHPYSLWHDEISKVAEAAASLPAYYASGLIALPGIYAEGLSKLTNAIVVGRSYAREFLNTFLTVQRPAYLGPLSDEERAERRARMTPIIPASADEAFYDLSKPLPQRWGPSFEPPELDESFIDDLYAWRYGIDPRYAPKARSDESALDLLALSVLPLVNPVPDYMRAEAGTLRLDRAVTTGYSFPAPPSQQGPPPINAASRVDPITEALRQTGPGQRHIYQQAELEGKTESQVRRERKAAFDAGQARLRAILAARPAVPAASFLSRIVPFLNQALPIISRATWPLAALPLVDLIVGMETPAMANRRQRGPDPFNPLTAEAYPTDPDTTDPFNALGIIRNASFHRPPLPEPAGPYGQYDPPYNRTTWGGWRDADRDKLNTRQEVLLAESLSEVIFINPSGNYRRATFGEWIDPYTGDRFTHANALHVDHMVPISNAHASGAWAWDRDRKRQFYNDLTYAGHLNATYSETNIGKGSLGPEEWLPLNQRYWHQYAIDWVNIKARYSLSATDAEIDTLEQLLTIDPDFQDLRDDTKPYSQIQSHPDDGHIPLPNPVGNPAWYPGQEYID